MDTPPIYLDYNATTPIDPAVAGEMLPYLYGHFGNPSSSHPLGAEAKRAVELARRRVAALIGARPEEIVFTSGGSEANNMVILGIAEAYRDRGRHLVTSAVEHPAVVEPCRALEARGFRLTRVPVDGRGRADPEAIAAALREDTILVSVMHANNEVGTIQPIAEIAAEARRRGVPVHTDAAQSAGKIPVDVSRLGVDFLSLAGHKLYGPKGVGALFIRSGRTLPPLIHGAAHESGRRAGTENVLEIVGLGKAAELAAERLEAAAAHGREMRDRLWAGLAGRFADLRRNGDPEGGLPNTLSVGFRGVDASTLLAEIGHRVAASAGAACHADRVEVSHVLQAMGVPEEYAMGTVRFSVGRGTTPEEIDAAVSTIGDAVQRLRGGESALPAAGEAIRLTRFTHGLGCACKLRPQALERVLRALPPAADPAVLVGTATADDAAVYRLRDDLAVVQTVDFFTPVTDDPADFGAISAANSLSDLYAMGATPRFALSVVGFPSARLPMEVLERILSGAVEVARDAGIEIIGGHSVEDTEPKFGLVVTGTVDPRAVRTNAGARAGDVLVLTKPLGTGMVTTAAKRGLADPEVTRAAVATMRRLNREAAEAMLAWEASACTDVTGFGLLGHLHEMAAASRLDAEVEAGAVPVLDGVRELAAAGMAPGGSEENLAHFAPFCAWPEEMPRSERLILADAQTSGGLLIAVAPEAAGRLLRELESRGVREARRIGAFTGAGEGRIRIR